MASMNAGQTISDADGAAAEGPAFLHVRVPEEAECLPMVAPGGSTAEMVH